MSTITIETPVADRLARLGVDHWPQWEKGVADSAWTHDVNETSNFPDGHVVVTPADGEPVGIVTGNLLTFPAGLTCTWKVLSPFRKRYRFG
jgi:uncharacterized cupin superfamily protein